MRRGPAGPLKISPTAVAVVTRAVIARPIISGAVVRRVTVAIIIVRAPPTATPGVADPANLLGIRRDMRGRCNWHGRRDRRCRDSGEQRPGNEANSKLHDLFLHSPHPRYRTGSDQIVAEPKCNADERIFGRAAVMPPVQATTSSLIGDNDRAARRDLHAEPHRPTASAPRRCWTTSPVVSPQKQGCRRPSWPR